MGFFSSIGKFLSGIPVDEDSQNIINEVKDISEAINESNETNLTGQGSTSPTNEIAPLEELEEIEYDYGDLEEDDTPIVNSDDNISTSNPEPLACEVKIKDAFFAKKEKKAVPSTEVGSYKFGNPHTVNKDNTAGREDIVNDILNYIVQPLGGKYNNATTKANIETALPYEKLGKNVPFTFNLYDSETQTSSPHNSIIKNTAGKYDGRKQVETKDMEAVVEVIVKNVITPSDGHSYITTKEDVKKALTKKEYARDEVVENIKLYKKINTYTKITKANLGSKVYLVAKTENFRNGESVKFKIFENGDKLLSDYVNEEEQLPFLLGINQRTEVTGVVVTDDVDNPETGNIKEGVAAVEIALRPKKDKPTDENDMDANFEDWKKKFKKLETDTKDKEDKLYLKVSSTSYPDIGEVEFLKDEPLVVKDSGRVNPSTLSISDKGIEFLKAYESKVKRNGLHVLYDDDAGYCTIGYGHLVSGKRSCNSIANKPANFVNGLSDEEAKELLKSDLIVSEF